MEVVEEPAKEEAEKKDVAMGEGAGAGAGAGENTNISGNKRASPSKDEGSPAKKAKVAEEPANPAEPVASS